MLSMRYCGVPVGPQPSLGLGLLTLCCFLAHGAEPLRWRWSHPEPHGNNIKGLAWSEARSLWVATAEQGALYTSRDGLFWIPRESGTRQPLRAAAFLGSRVLVTGAEGVVLYADAEDQFQPGQLADAPTMNWLEGVTAAPELAVAVGDEGAVYSTVDGIEWTPQTSGVTNWFRDVVYGHGMFVAVGEDGVVITSGDGVEWVSQASGVQSHFNRVGVLDDGFLAVGEDGVARFSADGTSWVEEATGAQGDLFVAGAVGSDVFVAGDGEVRVRIEGQWKNQLSQAEVLPSETYLSSVSLPGTVFLAGRTGWMVEGYRGSSPSYEWVLRTTPDRPWLFDMAYVTNLFVAVGDQSTIITSVDGLAWSFEFPPTNYPNSVFLGVGGDTNLLVGAGSGGSLMISPHAWTNVVMTDGQGLVTTQQVSTLGVVWKPVEPALTTNGLQGVTCWRGTYYVSGDKGILLRTVDGTNWVTGRIPGNAFLSGLAGSPEALVAVGTEGGVYRSTEGSDWEDVSSNTINWVYKVRYLADRFVAVGQEGLLLTSADGHDWEQHDTGTTEWLTDVTWIQGVFYVVGTAGTVLRSEDGVSWVDEGALTLKALFGCVADAKRLYISGAEGVVLRSPLALVNEPVAILKYSRALDDAETRWESIYLFGGETDQRFTLDRTAGLGGEWTTGSQLEILQSGGTLFFLEGVAVTNAPPEEFYGTTLLGAP